MKNPESVILEVVSTPWNVSQSQKKHYLNGRIKTSDIKSEEDNGSGEWSYTIMINTTAARILWTLTMEIDDNLLHSYLHILTGAEEREARSQQNCIWKVGSILIVQLTPLVLDYPYSTWILVFISKNFLLLDMSSPGYGW